MSENLNQSRHRQLSSDCSRELQLLSRRDRLEKGSPKICAVVADAMSNAFDPESPGVGVERRRIPAHALAIDDKSLSGFCCGILEGLSVVGKIVTSIFKFASKCQHGLVIPTCDQRGRLIKKEI
jgi:hypothetical protein